jgi:hypothetical protein
MHETDHNAYILKERDLGLNRRLILKWTFIMTMGNCG